MGVFAQIHTRPVDGQINFRLTRKFSPYIIGVSTERSKIMSSYIATLTYLDAYTRQRQRHYELVGIDFTAAAVNAAALLTAAQALTNGAVVKSIVSEVDLIVAVPGAGSNVDAGATFQFGIGPGKRASVKFPMPVPSVVDGQGNIVLTDALVAAFTGLYTGGNLLLSDGEAATDILRGTLDT